MTPTTLQAEVSKTAAFNGAAVAIAAKALPASITIRISSLTAAKVAHLAIQTSVDDFASDIRTEAIIPVKGPFSEESPFVAIVHHYDMPGLRVGTTDAEVRIALTYIDGSATIVYDAFATFGA
jgi:hypothetical protein